MLDRFPVLKLRSLLFIKLPEKLLLLLPLTKLLLLLYMLYLILLWLNCPEFMSELSIKMSPLLMLLLWLLFITGLLRLRFQGSLED